MPRTDDLDAVDIAGSERRSHVRAAVIDREVLSIAQKNGDHATMKGKGPPFAFGNRANFRDRLEFRRLVITHVSSLLLIAVGPVENSKAGSSPRGFYL